jgi:hypothetical protein
VKPPPAGLCAGCRWARRLASARSAFLRCDRSDTDPGFPRYPALPVVACAGYEPGAPPAEPPARPPGLG